MSRIKDPNAYHHGDLRRALLQAALDLVAEVGVQGFSLREVARRAGVTHAAPYRHFPSKESLVAALAEDGFSLLLRFMRDPLDSVSDDPLQRMQACSLGYLRFAGTYPAHFHLMFGAHSVNRDQYPSLVEAGQQAFRLILDLIKAGQASGQLRTGNPIDLSLAAWSAFHGMASLWVDGQLSHLPHPGDLESCGAMLAAAMLDGFRAVAAG